MHLYYCAGLNSQSFVGVGGSGQIHSVSGREHFLMGVAGSRIKKTVLRRALV